MTRTIAFSTTAIVIVTLALLPQSVNAAGGGPSGAYKDSGDGASENKRIVFSCNWKPTRQVSRCTARYSGTGDGAPARIVGTFQHKTYVFNGFWIESKSNSKCRKTKGNSHYWGRVKFVFQRDLKSWKGKWNYCSNPLKHSWNGKK